jgi:hypothetical protein
MEKVISAASEAIIIIIIISLRENVQHLVQ